MKQLFIVRIKNQPERVKTMYLSANKDGNITSKGFDEMKLWTGEQMYKIINVANWLNCNQRTEQIELLAIECQKSFIN